MASKVHKGSVTHPKMSMKQWEGSPMDTAMDKRLGYKEGSKADTAADRAAIRKINKGR